MFMQAFELNEPLTIRQAIINDQPRLKEIIDLSFPRFFRFFAIHSINSEGEDMLVSEAKDQVVGFSKLIDFHIGPSKYGCLLWLAVHPAYRLQGFATELVMAGTKHLNRAGAKAVFATVKYRNKASLATFIKVGFGRVGFLGLWRLFGWRVFGFYRAIWYAPGEVVLMHS